MDLRKIFFPLIEHVHFKYKYVLNAAFTAKNVFHKIYVGSCIILNCFELVLRYVMLVRSSVGEKLSSKPTIAEKLRYVDHP